MNTIQQVARQAAHKAWCEGGNRSIHAIVADAVAVAVLRELKQLMQAGSYVRYSTPEAVIDEALAAFTPAEPIQQAVDKPRCGQCNHVEEHVVHYSAHQAFHHFVAPAEPQTPEPLTKRQVDEVHRYMVVGGPEPAAPVSSSARPTPQALDALLQDDSMLHPDADIRAYVQQLRAALRSLQADASAKEEQAFKAGYEEGYYSDGEWVPFRQHLDAALAAYRTQTGGPDGR